MSQNYRDNLILLRQKKENLLVILENVIETLNMQEHVLVVHLE